MEIDTIVPEALGPSRLIVPNPEDPYIADLLQVADSRIAELDGEVRRLNDEKDIIERKVKNFREQVSEKNSVQGRQLRIVLFLI